MGTCGYYGIVWKGRAYSFHSNWDSNPEGLGALIICSILSAIESGTFAWGAIIDAFQATGKTFAKVPTAADIEMFAPYTELGFRNLRSSTLDWFCITVKLQGHLEATLTTGYDLSLESSLSSPALTNDEYAWSYMVNLDTCKLDVYGWKWAGEAPAPDPVSYDFMEMPLWYLGTKRPTFTLQWTPANGRWFSNEFKRRQLALFLCIRRLLPDYVFPFFLCNSINEYAAYNHNKARQEVLARERALREEAMENRWRVRHLK